MHLPDYWDCLIGEYTGFIYSITCYHSLINMKILILHAQIGDANFCTQQYTYTPVGFVVMFAVKHLPVIHFLGICG